MNRLRPSAALVLAVFLVACTQTPVPTTYPYSEQKKMQAAHHWEVLAVDVAEQLAQKLTTVNLAGRKVAIEFSEDTPFNKGFRSLLLTQLVHRGVPVSARPAADSLKVVYETQLVHHRQERLSRTYPGALSATATYLATGVWVIRDALLYGTDAAQYWAIVGVAIGAVVAADVFSGAFARDLPHSEVVISASLMEGDDYLSRKTDIYYVNDEDQWHYQPPRRERTIPVSDGQ